MYTKKVITLCLSCLFILTLQAQDALSFKLEYKPNKVYRQKSDVISSYSLKVKGKGQSQNMSPEDTRSYTSTNSVTTTGSADANGVFPIKIEYFDKGTDDKKPSIPYGTTMYGTSKLGEMPKLDSIYSPDMDSATKSTIMGSMSALMEQITVPDKQMKVGEKYAKKSVVKLPIMGMSLDMDILTNYKLKSVEKTIANFDIGQVFSADLAVESIPIQGKGTSKGYMVFDMANNFYSDYTTHLVMNMGMNFMGISMKLAMTTDNKYTVIIE